MVKNKQASPVKRFLLFSDNSEVEILGESGRYWVCRGGSFLKSNDSIIGIKERLPKSKDTGRAEQ